MGQETRCESETRQVRYSEAWYIIQSISFLTFPREAGYSQVRSLGIWLAVYDARLTRYWNLDITRVRTTIRIYNLVLTLSYICREEEDCDLRMLRRRWIRTWEKIALGEESSQTDVTHITGLSGLSLKQVSQSWLNSGPISFSSASVGRI